MVLYWIFFLLLFNRGLSEDVCTTKSGDVTIVTKCANNEQCCKGNTSCCSGLPTVAIVTVTSSGAIISVVGVILVVYNIKLKKKQPIVQATSTTERDMHYKDPPANTELYDYDESGSRTTSQVNSNDTDVLRLSYEGYSSFTQPVTSDIIERNSPEFTPPSEMSSHLSCEHGVATLPSTFDYSV